MGKKILILVMIMVLPFFCFLTTVRAKNLDSKIDNIDGEITDEFLSKREASLLYYKRGVEYASQGQYQEAKKEFKKSLEQSKFAANSKDALRIIDDLDREIISKVYALHIFKGESYIQKRQFQQAIYELGEALQD